VNKTILAIDDDEAMLAYYRTVLGHLAAIRTAANLAEARGLLGGVDLIILDFDLRQDRELFQDIVNELKVVAPILLCSGVQDVHVPAFAVTLGIKGYWNKGADRKDLISLVQNTLVAPKP